MLIQLDGTIEGRSEQFETITMTIPKLYLDHYDYKLSIRSVILEGINPIEKQIISLITTAVDMNSFNLSQEVYAFESSGSDFMLSEPKHLREYKIQLKDFHTSQFILKTRGIVGDTKIQILLEISRDVRIQ